LVAFNESESDERMMLSNKLDTVAAVDRGLPLISHVSADPIAMACSSNQPATPLLASVLNSTEPDPDSIDFTSPSLVCPINVTSITNRWLNVYIDAPDQIMKEYDPKVSHFTCQMLKSYVGAAIRSQRFPPFIHSTQITAQSLCPVLATCMSIVQIYNRLLPGSERATAEVLHREMAKVYEERLNYDEIGLLAAFQSYLIYAMVLFFRIDVDVTGLFRQAKVHLQELASMTAGGGIMCTEEQQRQRPRWESWIVAEAKRRTLYTMYLFDNVLSQHEGDPIFLGTELKGLPAPASKTLWEAKGRRDWDLKYNLHLLQWPDRDFAINELWEMPPKAPTATLVDRAQRVDRWLEDLDEYGVMMYAVTSSIHGV
jgi:hypothetical protein